MNRIKLDEQAGARPLATEYIALAELMIGNFHSMTGDRADMVVCLKRSRWPFRDCRRYTVALQGEGQLPYTISEG